MIARAVVVTLVLLTCASPAQADDYALRLLRDWIKAVHDHVPGASDQSLASIAEWDRDDLVRLQPFIRALAGVTARDPRNRNPLARPRRIQLSDADAASVREMAQSTRRGLSANDFVKRAALLHTDVVLIAQLRPEQVPAPKPPPRPSLIAREETTPLVIARGPDGRLAGFELGNLNWKYARDLLDLVAPSPAADTTVALWYRAVTAMFASNYSFGEAWPHIERARELLPDDPGILFGDAAIQETLASSYIQDYVRVTGLPLGLSFRFVTSARGHLKKAEELFRKVLQKDPSFAEARLRLGRVISQSGRHGEALVELRAVVNSLPEPPLTFYAHLIAGDAERALARYDAAERSYQRALELFPTAQSARMALGHLARLRSDREGALALLQPTLAIPPLDRKDDDPWWDYHLGDGRRVVALLRQLRGPFIEGGQP